MYAMPNDSLVGAATEWDRRRARSNGWLRRAVYSSARDLDDAWPRERRSASLLRRRQPPSPRSSVHFSNVEVSMFHRSRTTTFPFVKEFFRDFSSDGPHWRLRFSHRIVVLHWILPPVDSRGRGKPRASLRLEPRLASIIMLEYS